MAAKNLTFNDIVRRNIGDLNGRRRLASQVSEPLRRQLDYTSVSRRLIALSPLELGEPPLYDYDPMVTAYVIGEGGDHVRSEALGMDRTTVPLFEITALPTIPISTIRSRLYPAVKRVLEKGVSSIKERLDIRVITTLVAAGSDPTSPNQPWTVSVPLVADILADAKGRIEAQGIPAARILMNPITGADLLKFDHSVLSNEGVAANVKTGVLGEIYNMEVITSRVCPRDLVIVLGEREFVGRMPERTPLTVVSADLPPERRVGFSMFMEVGVLCHNPAAIQIINLTGRG